MQRVLDEDLLALVRHLVRGRSEGVGVKGEGKGVGVRVGGGQRSG